MNPDGRVMKSYVWHEDQCFFVSTIERESSAGISPPPRYNETIVWKYDWEKKQRGAEVSMLEDSKGSIREHLRVCRELHRNGAVNDREEVEG